MMATEEQKTMAFVLYPGLTLLDMVGPLTVTADHTFADVADPEVVIVLGGGAPTIKAMGNPTIRDYLRQAADTVPVVGSVRPPRMVQVAIEYDPHLPFGGIDWDQVDRDIYEPMLGPTVQRQLADRPELLAKLSG
jgi:hypothetical protein